MAEARYPRIKTVYSWASGGIKALKEAGKVPQDLNHAVIVVILEEGEEEQIFCGESWCHGDCKLPAYVIPGLDRDAPYVEGARREMKMFSDMVAVGNVMQSFRVKWEGSKVEVPEKYREDFIKRLWW